MYLKYITFLLGFLDYKEPCIVKEPIKKGLWMFFFNRTIDGLFLRNPFDKKLTIRSQKFFENTHLVTFYGVSETLEI